MHILLSALHRPSKPTGVCRHAANLAKNLANTHEVDRVTLVIGAWQQDYFEQCFDLRSEKIKLAIADIQNRSLSRNFWFFFELPKLANSLNPDLVHVLFPIPFVRSLFSSPVVATVNDLYPYECPENFGFPQVLFNRLFLKQCINNSDGISCISNTTLDKLKFYFPGIDRQKKTNFIHLSVDFSQVFPNVPHAMKDSDRYPFILSVAQHRKNKNLDILIRAYDSLVKNNRLKDSTKLVIVGSSGPETENLSHLIQSLSLEDRVLLLSSIDDRELRWMYENCELFVLPSSTEGFGLPLAEAISLACPVVCSDIPIFREIGCDGCTYFSLEQEPVKNLESAIAQTLEKARAIDFASNSRFSNETTVAQYLQFYSSIISDNN